MFLSLKDVQQLENCSKATASRRLRLIRDVLIKEKHQKITLEDYSNVFDVAVEKIKKVLNINQ